jgi:uncharacterized membrane protein YfcA
MRHSRIILAVAGIFISIAQAASIFNISFRANKTEPSSDATILLCLTAPIAGAVCCYFLARILDRSKLRWVIASFLIPFTKVSRFGDSGAVGWQAGLAPES